MITTNFICDLLISFTSKTSDIFSANLFVVSDNTLLVGTKQGQLLVYTVQPTGSHEPRFNVLLERANKAFSKKPITQLAVVPEYHILISLSGQDSGSLAQVPHTHQSLRSGQWQSCPSTTYSSVSQVRTVAVLPKYHIFISLSGQDSGSLAQVPHTHQSLRSGQWQSCPSTTYSSVSQVRTVAVLPKYHILISLTGQGSGSLAQVPHTHQSLMSGQWQSCPSTTYSSVSQVRAVAVLPKYHILISLSGQDSGSLAQVPHTHQSLRSGQWQSCPSATYSSVSQVRTVAVLPKYHILISLSGQDSGSLAQVPHTHQSLRSGQWQSCPSTTYSSVSQIRAVAVLPKYHILISLSGQDSGSLAQVPHTHQSLRSGQWQSCPSTTYSSVSQVRTVAVLPKYHILISLSGQDSGSLAQVPHTHQSHRSGQWQSCPSTTYSSVSQIRAVAVLPKYHILISLSGQDSGSLAQVPHTHQSLRSGQWQSCPSTTYSSVSQVRTVAVLPKYHILISLTGQGSGSLAQVPHTHQSLMSGQWQSCPSTTYSSVSQIRAVAVLPKYHILISLSDQDSGSLAQVPHTHQSLRSGQWQSCPSTTYSSVSQVRAVAVLPKYHILISLSGQDNGSLAQNTTYSSVSQVRTVAVLPKYHILISLSGQDWQSCPSTTYSSVSQVRTVAVLPKYHILISLSGQDWQSCPSTTYSSVSQVRTVAVLPKYHILISLSGQDWQSCPSTTYSSVSQVKTVAVLPKYHILISLSGQDSGSLAQVPHTHQSLRSGQWQSCPSTTYSSVSQVRTVAVLPKYHILISLSGQGSGSLAQVPHTHQSLGSGQWQSCPSTTYSSVSQVRAVLPKYHILISLSGQDSGSLAQVPHTHQSVRTVVVLHNKYHILISLSGQWQSCPGTPYSSVSQVRTVAVLPKYHILISLSGQGSGSLAQVPHTHQSLTSGQWQSCPSTTYSPVCQDSGSLAQQVPHTHQSVRSGQWQSCPSTTYSSVSQVRAVAVLPKYHILISLTGQGSGSLAQVPHTHQSHRSGQWQSCPSTTYSSVSQVRTVAVLPKYHILISLSGQDSGQVPHTLQSLRSGQWQSCLSTTYSSVSQVRTVAISLSGQDNGSLAQVPHTHQSLRSGQWQSCPCTTYSPVSQVRTVAVLPKYHILISLSGQGSGSLAQVPHTHQSLRSGQWQSCPSTTYSSVSQVRAVAVLPKYHILIRLSCQYDNFVKKLFHTYSLRKTTTLIDCLINIYIYLFIS